MGIRASVDSGDNRLRVFNSTFTGYADGCDDGKYGAAIELNCVMCDDAYNGDMPILSGLTVDSGDAHAIGVAPGPFEG